MALIKCPECGKKISDKAKSCPQCGFPLEELKKANPQTVEKVTEREEANISSEPKSKINIKSMVTLIGALLLGSAIGVGVQFAYNNYLDSQTYQEAINAYSNDNLDEAYSKFIKIKGYKDSKDYINIINEATISTINNETSEIKE